MVDLELIGAYVGVYHTMEDLYDANQEDGAGGRTGWELKEKGKGNGKAPHDPAIVSVLAFFGAEKPMRVEEGVQVEPTQWVECWTLNTNLATHCQSNG